MNSLEYRNKLSPMQVKVGNELTKGLLNKQIAYKLKISDSTVKVHVRNLMKKYGANNRMQCALMIVGALQPEGVMAARQLELALVA
jgi:DNA-binding NarL/FixJ family response regulator